MTSILLAWVSKCQLQLAQMARCKNDFLCILSSQTGFGFVDLWFGLRQKSLGEMTKDD